MKKILVLSPHLDDASLSLADHILEWRSKRHSVSVITIFTRFTSSAISEAGKENMRKSGFIDVKKYEQQRIHEDKMAMQTLGVPYKHFNFIDGGFRTWNNKLVYEKAADLFSGTISDLDNRLINSIETQLKEHTDYDTVVIPLGVGKHGDHLIIRTTAQKIFKNKACLFYVDQPYLNRIYNWSPGIIKELIKSRRSIKWTSPKKKEILNFYISQLPFLVKKPIFYPEILLSLNEKTI